ncbi:hypothetical protein [Novosphingobium taihuense]|uniref:Uncharacterized protein n=1 Tax=Novosphingobium taihuense TaxID=260085 RepID=A0A7W7AER9_9SPHN|nr:hypothetical protein [Novosphingobium taihuense]MBB4615699.1 hypothetical protein [Novosphingobium taihuense]TWH80112.1 hypothetical protein IQ25_03796 [Novosphingobium taihuense]
MIDKFTIFLPHMLMAIAIWRLLHRDDLDDDPSLPSRKVSFRKPNKPAPGSTDA